MPSAEAAVAGEDTLIEDYTATVKESKRLAWCEKKFDSAEVAKGKNSDRWGKFRDYYDGKQLDVKLPDYRCDLHTNLMFSTVETIVPIMTDNRPQVFFLPPEEEDDDLTYKLGKVVEFVWGSTLELDIAMPKIIREMLVVGVCFVKVTWDKDANAPLGDICTAILDPDEVFPDPNAVTFNKPDCDYVIIRRKRTLEYLRNKWKKKGKYVRPEDQLSDDDTKMAYEYEGWFKEGTEMEVGGTKLTASPDMKVIHWTHNVLLDEKKTPYDDGEFPFVRFINYPRARNFWGISEIKHLIDLQKEYNKRTRQIIDVMNLMGNPIWIIDKQAGVKYKLLSNRPGLIVPKNAGTEVRRDPPPPIPRFHLDMLEHIKMNMDIVSGVHDVTQGRRPLGITAAAAILELQEAAQLRIRAKIRDLDGSLRRLARLILSRIGQYYTEERLIRILGQNGEQETLMFKSNPEEVAKYDISVISASTMPLSRVGRYRQALELFDRGVIDGEDLLEIMEFPGRRKIVAKQKQREQEAMAMQQQQLNAQAGLPPEGMPQPGGGMPPGGMPQGGAPQQGMIPPELLEQLPPEILEALQSGQITEEEVMQMLQQQQGAPAQEPVPMGGGI